MYGVLFSTLHICFSVLHFLYTVLEAYNVYCSTSFSCCDTSISLYGINSVYLILVTIVRGNYKVEVGAGIIISE